MAGDWIKMSTDLQTNPKVVRIASALKADRLRVVGGLHAVWCLFDAHSISGSLSGYTLDVIDDLIDWPGFAAAMKSVQWLEIGPHDSAVLPRYETHNGASAKRRAMEASRKRAARIRPQLVPDSSALDADEKRTREEKNREEKKKKNTRPKKPDETASPDGFAALWSAYPRKVCKQAAIKAFVKLGHVNGLMPTMLAAIEQQRPGWSELRYVPHLATWLNGRQWENEATTALPFDYDAIARSAGLEGANP